MYRKIYECQVKMWQSDATGLGFILPTRVDILGDNLGYFQSHDAECGGANKVSRLFVVLSEHIDAIRRSNDRL